MPQIALTLHKRAGSWKKALACVHVWDHGTDIVTSDK